MDKLGTQILKEQNKSFHIDELLAQQKMYSRAKIFQGLLIFITVPLPIIISILIKTNEKWMLESIWVFALYMIFASFAEKVLESTIGRLKKVAASIQEHFDLIVLKIKSNETLNLATVDRETVRHYSVKPRKNKKKVKSVTDWYSLNLFDIGSNIASILCQRTNIYYDFSVRKRYNLLMLLFVFLTFTTLLIISLLNSIDLKSFLVEVILPSIPIFMFSYKEINSNIESIDNLKHLKNLIESSLSELNIFDEIDENLLRKIQDRIYNNRVLSPLIPDLLYKVLRPRLEDEMNYSVNEKIKILRTIPNTAYRN